MTADEWQRISEDWRKCYLEWSEWAESIQAEIGMHMPYGRNGADLSRMLIAECLRRLSPGVVQEVVRAGVGLEVQP